MITKNKINMFCLWPPKGEKLNFIQISCIVDSLVFKNLLLRSFRITQKHTNQIKFRTGDLLSSHPFYHVA
ncbi:hypothetical protein MtrunA17_Chr1g0148831 [Medicago truncatula]|uniref:Uncharacterized protein n=1 Tax=Medicago truncatula TaxID=3880 RepID=A0A396JKS1_MEDTR|nr:hypothetical protein MtrunA17_Chr1g0148831 [Medicago truncatula]